MIDLKKTISEIVEQQRMKTKKPVDISLKLVPNDIQVNADRQHFMQIINNICDNAVKYSNEQVRIGISCTKDTEGKVIISISDYHPTLSSWIWNTPPPMPQQRRGGWQQGCIAPVVGRRQLFQHPQPSCVHHQTAPQTLTRPSYKDNQREGNRI